ncbi:hypothetical protein T440DRAFT_245548 [Plenodomus tracheiphilus IPT5]|uniref:Arf-GAP domain-containing protein n=1 Tax=Plenodomus tracheiphilus IPT5 TaxID=1408161 RepID=A0A6A7BL67_9PLEO|nr:hypothetical protein T440DRAFT_245548 [Plenodomus tracheiphilus IPT5]
MRCAALHRKLGTHISKVKSLSMDKWDNAQVDNMKRIGNVESNKTYNPRNAKPQIPIDIDEVDSAMERYIRQKYEQRVYMNNVRLGGQQNTGSTSSEDRPPPLPPKPTGRFGFGLRKAATSPRDLTPPVSPGIGGFDHEISPPRVNKPSRVFGSNVQTSGDGLDSKLATLRDMGFPDEKRNCTVLKGLNGNLDRTVEALIRLGEQNPTRSRGSTPTPPTKSASNGLSFERTNTAPAAISTNPFDALDAPAVQQQPQAASVHTQQAAHGNSSVQPTSLSNSYNPFLQQAMQASSQQQSYPQQQQQQQQQQNAYQQNPWSQQQQSLEQSFQGMQLSNQQPQAPQQPQQPLFPNRTGGYSSTQPSPYAQTNPFQQSFTPPPMPQIPEQYSSFMSPQPQYQSMSSPSSPGNPFLRSSKSQVFTPMHSNTNPYGQPSFQQQQQQQQQQPPPPPQVQPQPQQQYMQQPSQQQQFQQQPTHQQQFQQQQAPQQQQQQQPNPWATQAQSQVPTQPASNPWQNQQQSFQPQQTGHQTQLPSYAMQPKSFQDQQQTFQSQQQAYQQQSSNPFDKNSILSLYNQPQPTQQTTQQPQTSIPAVPTTLTASGHMNPFGPIPGAQPLSAAQTPGVRHVSNESVDFSGLMGGRHSPDAFSGLSSSFRR